MGMCVCSTGQLVLRLSTVTKSESFMEAWLWHYWSAVWEIYTCVAHCMGTL